MLEGVAVVLVVFVAIIVWKIASGLVEGFVGRGRDGKG